MTTLQLVTFRIDEHLVGIDILKVREINKVLEITPVQHAPAHVRGLVNLRGQTITVFDLGVRLGLPPRSITDSSHNVILKAEEVGLLVDGIGDVEEAGREAIEPPPANLDGVGSAFIECVVRLEDELVLVLSTERLLERPRDKGEFA
jgi:purine-binding chemotaxis protein CheW